MFLSSFEPQDILAVCQKKGSTNRVRNDNLKIFGSLRTVRLRDEPSVDHKPRTALAMTLGRGSSQRLSVTSPTVEHPIPSSAQSEVT